MNYDEIVHLIESIKFEKLEYQTKLEQIQFCSGCRYFKVRGFKDHIINGLCTLRNEDITEKDYCSKGERK